jgi:hypothetical protein
MQALPLYLMAEECYNVIQAIFIEKFIFAFICITLNRL